MSLEYPDQTPGITDLQSSVEEALLWAPDRTVVTANIIIKSTTVDARSTATTDLQAGLVMGQIAATKLHTHYSPTATDGSQVAVGVLAAPKQMLYRNVATQQTGLLLIAGPVRNDSCGGLDQKARSDMFGRIIFDDDFAGNRFGFVDVVAKTADYTVTASDNNRIFTNQGAAGSVNFTLPTIAKGLRYRFYAEEAQNITITSVVTDTLVVFNDKAADSVVLSSASKIIGGAWEIVANADATKWLVFPYTWNTATDGTTVTLHTINT